MRNARNPSIETSYLLGDDCEELSSVVVAGALLVATAEFNKTADPTWIFLFLGGIRLEIELELERQSKTLGERRQCVYSCSTVRSNGIEGGELNNRSGGDEMN